MIEHQITCLININRLQYEIRFAKMYKVLFRIIQGLDELKEIKYKVLPLFLFVQS